MVIGDTGDDGMIGQKGEQTDEFRTLFGVPTSYFLVRCDEMSDDSSHI